MLCCQLCFVTKNQVEAFNVVIVLAINPLICTYGGPFKDIWLPQVPLYSHLWPRWARRALLAILSVLSVLPVSARSPWHALWPSVALGSAIQNQRNISLLPKATSKHLTLTYTQIKWFSIQLWMFPFKTKKSNSGKYLLWMITLSQYKRHW